MTTPSTSDTEGYSWLESDEGSGAWMSEASCFTFLRSAQSRSVLADAAFANVHEIDLTGAEDAVEENMAEQQWDTAVFDSGNGWTVIYQNNGFPSQFAETLLASSTVEQGVVVFWNVNAVTEFSLWERGEQIVTFRDAHQRFGSDPDRLTSTMEILGIPLIEPTDEDVEGRDDWFVTYAQLMALAETITGVHLDETFLARPLSVGRLR